MNNITENLKAETITCSIDPEKFDQEEASKLLLEHGYPSELTD